MHAIFERKNRIVIWILIVLTVLAVADVLWPGHQPPEHNPWADYIDARRQCDDVKLVEGKVMVRGCNPEH